MVSFTTSFSARRRLASSVISATLKLSNFPVVGLITFSFCVENVEGAILLPPDLVPDSSGRIEADVAEFATFCPERLSIS